jgi:hypothetical protein
VLDPAIQCWGPGHYQFAVVGMIGFAAFVPLATLLFGMDKVLCPEDKEDIQYAPIAQMTGNVVKMCITTASALFGEHPEVAVFVGLVGNLGLLGMTVTMRLTSLRWIKWVKVGTFTSSAWNAGCAICAQVYPSSPHPTFFMAAGFACIWAYLPFFILRSDANTKQCMSCAQDFDERHWSRKAPLKTLEKVYLKTASFSHKVCDAEHSSAALQQILSSIGHDRTTVLLLERPNAERYSDETTHANTRKKLLAEFGIYSEEVLLVLARLWQMGIVKASDLSAGSRQCLMQKLISSLDAVSVHRSTEQFDSDGMAEFVERTYRGAAALQQYFDEFSSQTPRDALFHSAVPLDLRLTLSQHAEECYSMRVYNHTMQTFASTKVGSVDLEQDLAEFKKNEKPHKHNALSNTHRLMLKTMIR